jgi:hypothetical protein
MVSEAKKLAKRLNAKLRKSGKKNSRKLQMFNLDGIYKHIKTNWVEVKTHVKLTNFVRNRPESFQGYQQNSFKGI